MSFLVATGDALAVTQSRVMLEGYRIGRIARPQAARILALAVDNGLIAEEALSEAMARPDPDQSLVELACMAQGQFVRKSMGRLPTFGESPRLRGYTDSLSRLARESVRTWLGAFHASRIVRTEELAQAASEGTRALVTLALDAWNRIGEQVSSAVAQSVGAQEITLGLWVGPAFLNGMHGGYAPPPEEELDPTSMLTGVSVELNANPNFRIALKARHRDDPAVPLLMAAFEQLRQRTRTFELMTPISTSESSMGWSISEAIAPFAGDAITESGEATIPNELAEQLEEEFGIDVSNEHAAERIKERLAVATGRSPVVPVKGTRKELMRRFNEAAKGDGALAPAFNVILRAIPVLDALRRKHTKLDFSSYEESWSPMVALFTDLIGFDSEELLDHIDAAGNSGVSIEHTITLDSPVELARLAWTEVCVISAVFTELDRLA